MRKSSGAGERFLRWSTKKNQQQNILIKYFIKIKNLSSPKDIKKMNKKKKQATDGEKIFAICVSDKGLMSRIQINKIGKQSNKRWAENGHNTL